MLSPSEQMLYNAVRITSIKNGEPTSFGTGFGFACQFDIGTANLLITNKHVIDGADHILLRVHLANAGEREPNGKTENVMIGLQEGGIVRHPDDDVDLCGISIGDLADVMSQSGKHPFLVHLNNTLIPTPDEWNSFDALEEIVMVGCPNGLFDSHNSLPIIRRGTTATHLALPYEGRQEFMIDAACFPGSSGSPVYLYNQMGHYNKARGGVDLGGTRLKLVGVLYGGPTITQNGQIILSKQPQVQMQNMMHLGCVVRSSRILELADIVRRDGVLA